MGKQRRFIVFADGEGWEVRGVAGLRRTVKDLNEGDFPAQTVVVYEGQLGEALTLVENPEEV